jgi:hypothetical protein
MQWAIVYAKNRMTGKCGRFQARHRPEMAETCRRPETLWALNLQSKSLERTQAVDGGRLLLGTARLERQSETDSGEWRIYYFVGHPGERKKYPSLGLKPKNFRSVGTYSEAFPDALIGTKT